MTPAKFDDSAKSTSNSVHVLTCFVNMVVVIVMLSALDGHNVLRVNDINRQELSGIMSDDGASGLVTMGIKIESVAAIKSRVDHSTTLIKCVCSFIR